MDKVKESFFSRQSIHLWIYFIGLCLLVISMPTSRTGISIAQILLGANWLAEGQFKKKFSILFNNKAALAFISIFFLSVIGLAWSSNPSMGVSSVLKTNLPILTLTLIIVTSPALDIKKSRMVLFFFIGSVLLVSFIGLFLQLYYTNIGFRDLTLFASHLYVSIMLIMAAFFLPWLVKQISDKKYWFFISILLSIWMIIFLLMLRSLSGLISLFFVMAFLTVYVIIYNKSIVLKSVLGLLFVGFSIISVWGIIYMYNITYYDKNDEDAFLIEKYTKAGTPYFHDLSNPLRENGNLVYINIAEEELKKAWEERSELKYFGKTHAGTNLRDVLFRYMSSKGLLKKDKEHVYMLNDDDISAIENGITNHLYKNWPGILARIHHTMSGIHDYRNTNDPMPSTLTQRVDLWKGSFNAFQERPIIGWGTGEIYNAVVFGLENNQSGLRGYEKKPHNQYLVYLIRLGVIGLIAFIALYTYTIIKSKAYKFLAFNVFLVAFAANMLGNNPIEAQYGQTLFVFFTLFFCFIYPKSLEKEKNFSEKNINKN